MFKTSANRNKTTQQQRKTPPQIDTSHNDKEIQINHQLPYFARQYPWKSCPLRNLWKNTIRKSTLQKCQFRWRVKSPLAYYLHIVRENRSWKKNDKNRRGKWKHIRHLFKATKNSEKKKQKKLLPIRCLPKNFLPKPSPSLELCTCKAFAAVARLQSSSTATLVPAWAPFLQVAHRCGWEWGRKGKRWGVRFSGLEGRRSLL